jgi:hypothetical protein
MIWLKEASLDSQRSSQNAKTPLPQGVSNSNFVVTTSKNNPNLNNVAHILIL